MERWLLFQRLWILYPAPTWRVTSIHNLDPKGSAALFWPLWALHADDAQTHMQANTHAHKINK